MSEVHFNARVGGELGMERHFGSPVIGEGFAHRLGDVFEAAFEGAAGGLGVEAVHVGEQDEAAGAFDQRADGGAVGSALDEIAFPVAWDQASGDFFRPLGDPDIIGDEALPAVSAARTWPAGLASLPQSAQQLTL
jgi:hypothetical protein